MVSFGSLARFALWLFAFAFVPLFYISILLKMSLSLSLNVNVNVRQVAICRPSSRLVPTCAVRRAPSTEHRARPRPATAASRHRQEAAAPGPWQPLAASCQSCATARPLPPMAPRSGSDLLLAFAFAFTHLTSGHRRPASNAASSLLVELGEL